MTTRPIWISTFVVATFASAFLTSGAESPGDPEDATRLTLDPIGGSFVGFYHSPYPLADRHWPPQLLVILYDLNRDGRLDLVVSTNYLENGKAGNLWDIYLHEGNGYRWLPSPISLNHRSTVVRPTPGVQGVSLLNPWSGGASRATLVQFDISGAGVTEQTAFQYYWSDAEDMARAQETRIRFPNLRHCLKRMDFADLEDEFADRLHHDIRESPPGYPKSRHTEPLDARPSALADTYVNARDEIYNLADEQPDEYGMPRFASELPKFASPRAAIDFCLAHRERTLAPSFPATLYDQFPESDVLELLIPAIVAWPEDYREYRAGVDLLLRLVRQSSDSDLRRHMVHRVLAAAIGETRLRNTLDLLEGFEARDFNENSRRLLMEELNRLQTSAGTYGYDGRIARWAGLFGMREAIPLLRILNEQEREAEYSYRAENPLYRRYGLLALARMGETDAVEEAVELIDNMPDRRARALALPRLEGIRHSVVVAYLKSMLFSDAKYETPYRSDLPVTDAYFAGSTFRTIVDGFPEGSLEQQRTWIETQTTFDFIE